uniref:Uncharacterized protein n=1 Tax=Rhizophora mucronata TaxID=61149 RepID=A0A2P2IK97_RHIMU
MIIEKAVGELKRFNLFCGFDWGSCIVTCGNCSGCCRDVFNV